MEVGLDPSHIVLDGAPAPLPQKGADPQFSAHFLSPNGWVYQDATWYGGRLQPWQLCVRWGPSFPSPKGAPPQFLSIVRCTQTTGWMKTSLGTEVDLGPDHIVLDGIPALRERGTAAPIFSIHDYCGHGRPSQLLLSCCYHSSYY